MKAEILALLREKKDYISGQELCEHFGVSRTAVWKAINQLKKEGYQIVAVQNRGYQLQDEEEVFGQNELNSRIHTKWAGHPVSYYDSIGSTNLQAKQDADNGAPEGALIVADMQTAGRGRRGRAWSSPAGTNVYFTLILKPDYEPDRASMITLIMAMAVAEGIHMTCGVKAQIKWPNDIVVNGKKLCGILTEMSVERDFIHHVVVGVGINVGLYEFDLNVAPHATNLEEICGRKIPRATLVANVMEAFEKYYEKFMETKDLGRLQEEYNQMLANKDKEVRVLDPKGVFIGIARGVNSSGELLVELEDGQMTTVYAGEVSVRGIYGYV